MATEKYRKAFKEVMEKVRSMSDREFLEIIRSQDGELGDVFGLPDTPVAYSKADLKCRVECEQLVLDFSDDVEYYSSVELFYYNAANDSEFLLAA
jgi:hypothetical protein